MGNWNQGTLDNNGIITIGNVSGTNKYGINNESVFNNNLAAQINDGIITIGANNRLGSRDVYDTASYQFREGPFLLMYEVRSKM